MLNRSEKQSEEIKKGLSEYSVSFAGCFAGSPHLRVVQVGKHLYPTVPALLEGKPR